MKVDRIDHLHVIVKDLQGASKLLSEIMGTHFFGPRDTGLGFKVAFDNLGLELMEPTASGNPVAEWMEEYGEGLFSISLKVPNLKEAVEDLKAKGIRVEYFRDYDKDKDYKGDVKAARTVDPKQTFGMVFELVEYKDVLPVAAANWGKIGELPLM
jgi:methylmalonyl-CoA/ethylmalonyl-CoA epimerase